MKRRNVQLNVWKQLVLQEQVRRNPQASLERIQKAAKKKQRQTKNVKTQVKVLSDSLSSLVNTVKEQRSQIQRLENELSYRQEEITNIRTRGTLDGRKIHPAGKETSMYLQDLGVAENKVGTVVKIYLKIKLNVNCWGSCPQLVPNKDLLLR